MFVSLFSEHSLDSVINIPFSIDGLHSPSYLLLLLPVTAKRLFSYSCVGGRLHKSSGRGLAILLIAEALPNYVADMHTVFITVRENLRV